MELLIDRKVPAASLFSGPYYFLEQLGFRKIIDTTFMMASMVTGAPDPDDVRKYFRALRRAQRDIDLRPSCSRTTTRRSSPVRFHAQMDTRRWGRANGWCSSRIRNRPSTSPSNGSSSTASSRAAKWARATTKPRSSINCRGGHNRPLCPKDTLKPRGRFLPTRTGCKAEPRGHCARCRCLKCEVREGAMPTYGASRCSRTSANTSWNICGVSTPVSCCSASSDSYRIILNSPIACARPWLNGRRFAQSAPRSMFVRDPSECDDGAQPRHLGNRRSEKGPAGRDFLRRRLVFPAARSAPHW